MPDSLSCLSELRTLQLGTNQITGMLPVDILGTLSQTLRLLDISENAVMITEVGPGILPFLRAFGFAKRESHEYFASAIF